MEGCALILLKCDCGKTLQAPTKTAARLGKCPSCGQLLPLPRWAEPPTVAPLPKLEHVLKGHRGPVRQVQFSPDGSLLATVGGSEGGAEDHHKFAEIRIWDTVRGRTLASMQGHQDTVLSCAFAADGETLVTGGKDHLLIVWDVSRGMHDVVTGLKMTTLRGHGGRVSSVVVSSSHELCASGADDGTIRLWSTESWRLVDTLHTGREGLCKLAFSPDGSLLAGVWRSRGAAILWDIATRKEFLRLSLRRDEDAEDLDLAFSPDGSQLAILSTGEVRLWDVSSCQVLTEIDAPGVHTIAYAPDGHMLATAGWELKTRFDVKLWDTTTGDEDSVLGGHTDSIYSMAFSPDSRQLASGGRDLSVQVWDLYPR
jgi:WD40 repeat protein